MTLAVDITLQTECILKIHFGMGETVDLQATVVSSTTRPHWFCKDLTQIDYGGCLSSRILASDKKPTLSDKKFVL